jgi:hypothetical protein
MTELFHYSFDVIIAYLLYQLYNTNKKSYLYWLIALVFFLIPFRESWVFALFGLLPLVGSLRNFLKFSVLLFVGLTTVLLYQKYFQAAFPVDYFHQIKSQMDSQSLIDVLQALYQHFLYNIEKYFLSETYDNYKFVFYYKYFYVILLIYTLTDGIFSRNKAILSSAIIALVFFMSLLVLYDPFGWREVRALAASFILMSTILILSGRYWIAALIILFQFYYCSDVIDAKQKIDQERRHLNVLIRENKTLLDDFSEFEKYLTLFEKKKILVLIGQNIVDFDNSPLFYQLPLMKNDKEIRYSFIYRHFDISESKCDLYISNKKENIDNMELLGSNERFFFYRRKK